MPRTPGRQVVSPQVARKAVDILHGDTTYPGTSASAFTSWYAAHPGSPISGKTGTAPGVSPRTHKADKNGALWFVGMTPELRRDERADQPRQPELAGVGAAGHPRRR